MSLCDNQNNFNDAYYKASENYINKKEIDIMKKYLLIRSKLPPKLTQKNEESFSLFISANTGTSNIYHHFSTLES